MGMNVDATKGCATGRWPEVIRTLAPQLSSTIERGRRHGPCDLCGGVDRCRCRNNFAETGGIICNQCGGGADGFAVLMWANGWTFPQALEAVANYVGLTDSSLPMIRKHTPRPQPKKDWSRKIRQLEQIWDEAQPESSRLRQYIEYRGLAIEPPATLRFHPSLEYWHDNKSYGNHPCMVAKIIRDGELVGLHRTYLDENEAKADVPCPKKTIKCADSMSGGAIRLFDPEPDKPLVLCEGIETALAISDHTRWPVWSCVNATMLEKVVLPDNVKSIYIAADKDRSEAGKASAEKLSRRLVDEGRTVQISLPPIDIQEGQKSVDWLDFYTQEVAHG